MLSEIQSISEREREVFQHLLDGHTNQEIARFLGISLKTVEEHLTRLIEKSG